MKKPRKIPHSDMAYYGGLTRVCVNSKWGLMDKRGEMVIPCMYDEVCDFRRGRVIVELNGKQGFIDKKNKIILPIIYDKVRAFEFGRSAIALNDQFGFTDTLGRVVIPLIYDVVENFEGNFARVRLNNRWAYVDKNGDVCSHSDPDDGYLVYHLCSSCREYNNFVHNGGVCCFFDGKTPELSED